MSTAATLIGRGLRSAQPTPASGAAGQLYYVTDEGVTERWSGSAWQDVSDSGSATATHIADSSDAHDASAISVADSGGYFTGTDVETALAEVGAVLDDGNKVVLPEASAPSTPASGKVVIYAKSDGRVYSKDDAGTEYGPFDVAGGGGAATGMPIDQVPVSPHADDDEFDGSSLDGSWTNPSASANGANGIVVGDGVLELTVPSSGIKFAGISKPSPTGSFKVLASVEYNDTYTSDIRFGVYVAKLGAKGHVLGPSPQDGSCAVIGATTTSSSVDWSGYDGHLAGTALAGSRKATVRIRWDAAGSTLYFGVWIGTGWSEFNSRGSMTQPDEMGLAIYGQGGLGAATPCMRVDWFRVEV